MNLVHPWEFRTMAQHWWFVRQWMMAMVQMRGMFINATRWSIPKSDGAWIWEIGAAGDQFGYSVSTLTYYNICGGWCTKLSWFKWGMCSLHKTYQYQLNCHQKYQQMIVQHYQPTYQPINKNFLIDSFLMVLIIDFWYHHTTSSIDSFTNSECIDRLASFRWNLWYLR